MSTFTPGSGDLNSTNLPSAFVELAALLQLAEIAIVNNPPNNVTLTSDIDGQSFGVNVNLPITTSVDSSGQPVIIASDYITSAGGTGTLDSTGSDLNSTTLATGILEIAQLLHAAEKASAEPQPDNIQINYNLENGTADITATIPQTISVVTGKVTVTPTDYV